LNRLRPYTLHLATGCLLSAIFTGGALLMDGLSALHEATLILLERTGVRIESPAALDLLAAHGVRLDSATGRVYPRADQIDCALSSAPHMVRVYGRDPDHALDIGAGNSYALSGGASLRVLTLDGRYETGNLEHLRQFNVLLDALPSVAMCINQIDPVEFHGPGLYRRLAAEMFVGCAKPICFQAANVRDITAMVEMGSAVRGSREALVERPLFSIGLNAEPPLSISKDIADAFLLTCRYGLPVSLGNYHMLGSTAPATVAGGVVQLNAVQLAAVLLAQLAHPGVPVFYTAFSGNSSPRTLDVIGSDPVSVQQQRLTVAMGRSYGLPVYSYCGSDARAPDPQAAAEHSVQFLIAMEAGANLIQGPTSMLDQMMMSSFVQAVLDDEIWSYVCAARRQPDISPETLALEAIHDVVTDPTLGDLKFAAHPHTARHLRDDRWQPAVFEYTSFAEWQKAGAATVVARAAARAEHILATHRPPTLDMAVADEVRRIADQ
jgi:trimethylamine--corrinoid protein Co-methyltransferase